MIKGLQVTRPDLTPPNGRDFFVAEAWGGPVFTTKVVSEVFFGHKSPWLYRHLGGLVLDGVPVEPERSEKGHRQFRLYHVERIAHALFSSGRIDLRNFENCLLIVKSIADIYRLL